MDEHGDLREGRWDRFSAALDQALRGEPVLRVDPADAPDGPPEPIDCASRLPICRAVCCRLAVPLSQAEVDRGQVHWDRDHPYVLERTPSGQCGHIQADSLRCCVYEERPRPCRVYSCRHDPRIWRDFEARVLNEAVVAAIEAQPGAGVIELIAHPVWDSAEPGAEP